MTAAVYRNMPSSSSPSLSVPPTQNTAPVLEFNCLYTHDVRKKQKKWQDGLLRYHTFNKRVMVYDLPRNLVGDMHWTGDAHVQEGDELALERGGVKVEVADCIGHTETDLTELRKSKKKEPSVDTSSSPTKAAPTPRARPSALNISRPAGNTQLKHRSLNALLDTPKGPIGKAVLPTRSPFEERHQDAENAAWEEGRPPKRPKTAAWSATRTTKPQSPIRQKETPRWARASDSAKHKKNTALPPGQQRLGTKEVIELSDNIDLPNPSLAGFSDEILAPSSPMKESITREKPAARSSPPAFQTQNAPRPQKKAAPAQQPIVVNASPPKRREDTKRVSRDAPVKSVVHQQRSNPAPKKVSIEATRKSPSPPSPRFASSKTGQTLRLAATAPKKRTLLCQDQLSKKPKRLSSTNTDDAVDSLLNFAAEKERQEKPPNSARVRLQARLAKIDEKDSSASISGFVDKESPEKRPMTAQEKLQARLAKIDEKGGSASISRLKPAMAKLLPEEMAPIDVTSDETLAGSEPAGDLANNDEDEGEGPIRRTSHEESAIELARLDQLMLPPAASSTQRPKPAPSKQTSPKHASPKRASPQPQPQPPPPKEDRSFRRVASESATTQNASIPGAPMRYTPSPTKRSRESTPALNDASRPPTPVGDKQRHAPAKTNRNKMPLEKSVSLNVTPNGTSAVMLGRPFQAPGKANKPKEPEAPKDLGPWSRDAFDLFSWRPPGWDEEGWCPTQVNGEHGPVKSELHSGIS